MNKTFVISCVDSKPNGILVLLALTMFQGEPRYPFRFYHSIACNIPFWSISIYTLEIVPSIVI
jgi:hypothetical protein